MHALAHPSPGQTLVKLRAPRPWFTMRITVFLGQDAKLLIAINLPTSALIYIVHAFCGITGRWRWWMIHMRGPKRTAAGAHAHEVLAYMDLCIQ